jgi:hypothetical protein
MAMTFGGNPTPADVARSTQPNTFTENQTIVGNVSATQTVFASSGNSEQWNAAYATATEYGSVSSTFASTASANTFTENQTFDGTNNIAPNQTAASGSSIMTKDLVQERINNTTTPRRLLLNPSDFGWLETPTNGATFATVPFARALLSNTNAAATAIRYVGAYMPQFYAPVGAPSAGVNTGIDWNRRLELRYSIIITAMQPNHKAHFRFGQTRSTTTLGPNTVKGVGTIFEQTNISGFVHNGTTLTTQSLVSTLSSGQRYEIEIISLGTGAVEFYVNGTEYWTSATSEGPTGWGSQENTQLAFMIENNGETTGFNITPLDTNLVLY